MTNKHFSNKYLGGGYYSFFALADTAAIDEILEFDPVNGKWKEVGKMKKARYSHAVSVIEYSASEAEQFCN